MDSHKTLYLRCTTTHAPLFYLAHGSDAIGDMTVSWPFKSDAYLNVIGPQVAEALGLHFVVQIPRDLQSPPSLKVDAIKEYAPHFNRHRDRPVRFAICERPSGEVSLIFERTMTSIADFITKCDAVAASRKLNKMVASHAAAHPPIYFPAAMSCQ